MIFHARRGSETKANDPMDLFLGDKIISAASVLSANDPSPRSDQKANLEYSSKFGVRVYAEEVILRERNLFRVSMKKHLLESAGRATIEPSADRIRTLKDLSTPRQAGFCSRQALAEVRARARATK
jgi:hypothetical protein